jgi:MFS family permease
MAQISKHWSTRLPFYYGWLIVAIAFVTMAIGVTGRTAFSLLLPPLMDEFKWDRGLAAGAFSFGFLFSAAVSPFVGRVVDARGPRIVIWTGVALMSAGLLLAPYVSSPWQLYATLGVAVSGGANMMTYAVHSQFLPHWFVRRRALAISIAFAGAGVGAVLLLPWLQTIILTEGWRASCIAMGWLVVFGIAPITFFVKKNPADVGQNPDGDRALPDTTANRHAVAIIDPAWASIDWTLPRALRTARFWWIAVGYFLALIAWYAVQVHQTKYLVEIGFSPLVAAWALGAVSIIAIPGQILLGALSDRIGREWIWTAGCLGFAVSYATLLGLAYSQSSGLLYCMVFTQGFFGYALTSVMGPIVAEIFEGPHYGSIFGTITIGLLGGGAVGPWLAGAIHDATGSYRPAFLLIIGFCLVSIMAIWIAGPRRIRSVVSKRDATEDRS